MYRPIQSSGLASIGSVLIGRFGEIRRLPLKGGDWRDDAALARQVGHGGRYVARRFSPYARLGTMGPNGATRIDLLTRIMVLSNSVIRMPTPQRP